MKVPKRLLELLKKKQEYINKHRALMEKSVVDLQSQFLNDILSGILPDLTIKEGTLADDIVNYRKLSDVDQIFKQWNKIHELTVSPQIINTTAGIAQLENAYFGVAIVGNMTERIDKVIDLVAKKTNLRLGIDGGKMVRGGFLESFFTDQTMATNVKNYISKSITGQVDTKVFIKGLTELIEGVKREVYVNGKKIITQTGMLDRQYQRFAFDTYQQYDRAYASSIAKEFGMTYFIYQNGLIDDSRDFCVCHDGLVWSVAESETWTEWVPADGDYPEGYEIKQKDLYKHPGYMDYPGYQPLVDAGGYNCRHSFGYVSDELAYRLRPGLK